MPKHKPRTKPPAERRSELMDAAQKLFLGQGVAATTIEQITSEAGVAKGTFYLYFSRKEDILGALGDRFAEQHLATIKTALAQVPAADWKAKLNAWTSACLDGYLDSIELHDVLFYGFGPPTREGLVKNIVIDHLAGLLREGAEAGAWRIEDAQCAAVFVFSGLHAVVDDAYLREKKIHRARLTQQAQELSLRSVQALKA
jgi:AcrR family transcriptional regulator